ncbi:hypothetical protein FVE85_5017 [Porphyridium purpureum]|uniref:PKD domain-containing protein n=1 Tax=Porphyridium purpureum TaxID=35688 RepID=A0A5J4YSJ0_PORPP|nr:hypothetical protein FVE85_5017 [Porphyridium purpureum]|eukprot:POR8439..scf236_6
MARMFPLAWALAIALLATWSSLPTVVAQELCRWVPQCEPCLSAGTLALAPDATGAISCRAVHATCLGGSPNCVMQPCQKYVKSEETQLKMVLEYEDVSEVSLEFSASPVDVLVDYGDGMVTAPTSTGKVKHTYRRQGSYQVVISGSLGGIMFTDGLAAVASWGELGLTTLNGAFAGLSSLQNVPADIPRTVTNLSAMSAGSSFKGDIGTVATRSFTFATTHVHHDASDWAMSDVKDRTVAFCQGGTRLTLDHWGYSEGASTTSDAFSVARPCVRDAVTGRVRAGGGERGMMEFNARRALVAWVSACALLLPVVAPRDAAGAPGCDLCADNWLFILAAGGRSGSTTALSMFRMIPGFELIGEHAGALERELELHKQYTDLSHPSLAWSHPKIDMHALSCNTQELVKIMVYGAERATREPRTRVLGFKEIRYVSRHMLEFLSKVFPCARIIFTVREVADAEVHVRKWNQTRLHREWAEQAQMAQSVHKRFPKTTSIMAVEHLSVQLYNDVLHNLLGVRNCSFNSILGANLHGSYTGENPHDNHARDLQIERDRQTHLDGDCDLSHLDFRL